MNQMAEMVDEKQLDRIQAIIRGMTPQERENPKILNASRRKRIANGSGVSVFWWSRVASACSMSESKDYRSLT